MTRFSVSVYWLFYLLIGASVHLSCEPQDPSGEIVPVPVDFEITLSRPDFLPLRTVGGAMIYRGNTSNALGVRGFILYRASDREIIVYDRNCSYQPEMTCSTVELGPNNQFIHDPACCGSVFRLSDGSPLNGPARRPLYRYLTSQDGDIFRIYNEL